jgi:homocysteine S-methyltransferase
MSDKHTLLDPFLQAQRFVVLDGALATELEVRGADLNHALWSAKLLNENPELIKQVHLDYLHAGANVITTATYQASFLGFENQGYTKEAAIRLMQLSLNIAADARSAFMNSNQVNPLLKPVIAASVGPYGAAKADGSEYTGYSNVSIEALIEFHRERLAILVNSGAELIAFETIPCIDEAIAIKTLLEEHPGLQAWVSFSCKNETQLSSGENFNDAVLLLNKIDGVIAVGVNCTAPQYILSLIQIAKQNTSKLIIVYPNKGEQYNPVLKKWESNQNCNIDFIDQAKIWIKAGAKIIGGCCRTSPLNIQHLSQLV